MPRGIHSVKDAARSLGISEAHCRRLLESGKIQGTKLGHDWVVRVLKYKRKRRPKKVNPSRFAPLMRDAGEGRAAKS